jgi:hypothetical protein
MLAVMAHTGLERKASKCLPQLIHCEPGQVSLLVVEILRGKTTSNQSFQSSPHFVSQHQFLKTTE